MHTQFPDQMIAEDILHACREEAVHYSMMALDASDEELKQVFLAMHTETQKQHSHIYNLMKNRGWYPQQAGDLTVSGGWSGEFYPHGQGQRQPIDQPDKAWGKSTWEAHNTPRYENHHYSQNYERQQQQGHGQHGQHGQQGLQGQQGLHGQQGSPWGYQNQGIQEAYTRGPGGGIHHDHSGRDNSHHDNTHRDNTHDHQGNRYR